MSGPDDFVPLHCGNKNNRSIIMAGKIQYIAPVDSVSGMFGKREHSMSGKAVISNVRRKASQKFPGGHMYFSVLTKSTRGVPSASGLAWQNTFKQVCAATRARIIDPQHIAQDQVEFSKQNKYKTLYAFIWNKMRAEIES